MNVVFQSIGTIKTPFKSKEDMPVQSKACEGIAGKVILNKELTDGLDDLTGFSHIFLLYFFHQAKDYKLKVKPFLDNQERGLFATRAPQRPNAIGISVVKLIKIESNILYIENVDIIDGTPLLDIKPYCSHFDCFEEVANGWLKDKAQYLNKCRSDKRF